MGGYTHRNPRSTSSLAIRFSNAVRSNGITFSTSSAFPSPTTARLKNDRTIGIAHQIADVTESARHNKSGRCQLELTPSKTATRGCFELLGTLLRRPIDAGLSRATLLFTPALKASSAVFAASVYGGRLFKLASGTALATKEVPLIEVLAV